MNVSLSVIQDKKKRELIWKRVIQQKQLLMIGIPYLVYLIIFAYIPLWGWIMAFQNYKPALGVRGSEWVGFQHFITLFSDDTFLRVMRNTLAMSVLKLMFGFIFAIGFAIVLNEVRKVLFKKVIQTISYLPHFLSWVVAANMVVTLLSTENGPINQMLMFLGLINRPVLWLGRPEYFWGIITISFLWKSIGWSTVVYLSAMTAIDPSLYEAANVDGAGRLKKIWYITIPAIMPTIKILFIMNLGHILNAGFEQQLLLSNPMVAQVAEVLPMFVMRYGIGMGRYSFATAAGIFNSLVSIAMILTANSIAKKFGDERLF